MAFYTVSPFPFLACSSYPGLPSIVSQYLEVGQRPELSQ
jgi:hypothetical protein